MRPILLLWCEFSSSQVVGGQSCALIVHSDGHLSACGSHSNRFAPVASLSDGSTPSSSEPRPVGGALGRQSVAVAAVSVSKRGHDGHALAATTDGELYSWGDGQLCQVIMES